MKSCECFKHLPEHYFWNRTHWLKRITSIECKGNRYVLISRMKYIIMCIKKLTRYLSILCNMQLSKSWPSTYQSYVICNYMDQSALFVDIYQWSFFCFNINFYAIVSVHSVWFSVFHIYTCLRVQFLCFIMFICCLQLTETYFCCYVSFFVWSRSFNQNRI